MIYPVDSAIHPLNNWGQRVFCNLFETYSVKTMILLQKQIELAKGRDSNRLSKLMGCKQCFPIMRQLYKEARNFRLRFCGTAELRKRPFKNKNKLTSADKRLTIFLCGSQSEISLARHTYRTCHGPLSTITYKRV